MQTEETLIPYIVKALQLLKDAGLDAFGVTSPVNFGIRIEESTLQ